VSAVFIIAGITTGDPVPSRSRPRIAPGSLTVAICIDILLKDEAKVSRACAAAAAARRLHRDDQRILCASGEMSRVRERCGLRRRADM
jgi:hypothetical protein